MRPWQYDYISDCHEGLKIMGTDPSKISMGQLFDSLTPAQLVAIVSVALSVVGGAFGFGYGARGYLADNQIASVAHTEDTLALLRLKERILGLVNAYYDYRGRVTSRDATDQDRADLAQVEKNLFETVIAFTKQGLPGAGPKVRVRLGKGIHPSLTFEDDQTTYPLPVQLFAQAE
jgi:hypothetical protein